MPVFPFRVGVVTDIIPYFPLKCKRSPRYPIHPDSLPVSAPPLVALSHFAPCTHLPCTDRVCTFPASNSLLCFSPARPCRNARTAVLSLVLPPASCVHLRQVELNADRAGSYPAVFCAIRLIFLRHAHCLLHRAPSFAPHLIFVPRTSFCTAPDLFPSSLHRARHSQHHAPPFASCVPPASNSLLFFSHCPCL